MASLNSLYFVLYEIYLFLGEFDMRVKSCSANTENSRPIQLSDEHGCVLRPKMISKFMKIAGADTRASVVTYAFFHAFKFPDSMAVHIRCKVCCIDTSQRLNMKLCCRLRYADTGALTIVRSLTAMWPGNKRSPPP